MPECYMILSIGALIIFSRSYRTWAAEILLTPPISTGRKRINSNYRNNSPPMLEYRCSNLRERARPCSSRECSNPLGCPCSNLPG